MREKQNERVLNRLKQGPLTSMQAIEELGILRLGARVFELRHSGHIINTKTVVVRNRHDEECHVAEYSLIQVSRTHEATREEMMA